MSNSLDRSSLTNIIFHTMCQLVACFEKNRHVVRIVSSFGLLFLIKHVEDYITIWQYTCKQVYLLTTVIVLFSSSFIQCTVNWSPIWLLNRNLQMLLSLLLVRLTYFRYNLIKLNMGKIFSSSIACMGKNSGLGFIRIDLQLL